MTGSDVSSQDSAADSVARSLSELRDALVEASLALKEYQFKHDASLRCQVDSQADAAIARATRAHPQSPP